MHCTFKVIFVIVCCTISSSCRPVPPYSKQLYTQQIRRNPVLNYNSTQELSRTFPRIFNADLHQGIPLRTSGNTQGGSFANNLGRASSEKFYNRNEMKRRGLDVGILVNVPTPQQYDSDLERLESILAKALENRLVEEKYNMTQECPSCDEEVIIKRIIKPAYECDEWDSKNRVCILERNIGDTVTFYLSTGQDEGMMRQPTVTWKKEFHMRNSKERKEFTIDSRNPPENIIIGRKGFELRVSPITETDMEYNMFSATLQSHASFKSKLYFIIRIVAIDLGFVYVGEIVELNLRNFVTLPEKSLSFKWYMEKDGEHGFLPSNMKVSDTGSSIKISELRQDQEGVLACSVYSNLNILATKKRFLMKDLSKNRNVLQTSPNHTLKFKEEFRKKRDPKQFLVQLNSVGHSRQKRARPVVEAVDRVLLQPTSMEIGIPSYTTARPRYNDNNPSIEFPYDKPQSFEDNDIRFQEISDNVRDVRRDVNREPLTVEESAEGQRILERPQSTNEELSFQAGVPADEINAPDGGSIMNQLDNRQMNSAGAFLNAPETEFIRDSQQYLVNKTPPKKVQSGPLFDNLANPVNAQQKQNIRPSANQKQGNQYNDFDFRVKGRKPNQQDGYSDIVLNIGGIKETSKITTEMQIAKLISYCFNDLECSITATCERSKLETPKTPGFCKCLPGYNGVGIFCREGVWLSNSKLDSEEYNLDYRAYPDIFTPS